MQPVVEEEVGSGNETALPSEICISAQSGRLNADHGDMHGVGVHLIQPIR